MNKFTRDLLFDEEKHKYTVNGVELPSVTEIVAPLTYTKYTIDSGVLLQAKQRGTIIHEVCADYDFGVITDETPIAPDILPYLTAWKNFCHDYSPSWTMIEQQMACSTYAGTIDRVGEIDGKPVIVDIKTTSNMDRASKIALCGQLAGYTFLLFAATETKTFIDHSDCMGVQLKKDGTYAVHSVGKIEEKYGFDSSELFHQLLDLNQLLKGDRRIVE